MRAVVRTVRAAVVRAAVRAAVQIASGELMVATVAARASWDSREFASRISWDSRQWLRWERLLYASMQRPALGIALLAALLPCTLVALPVMPLLSLALLRCTPTPRGRHDVGIADVEQRLLSLPGPAPLARLRVFYPSKAERERPRASWLPDGPARGRYATQHGFALPLPRWATRFLAPFLTSFLRLARCPPTHRVTRAERGPT